MTTTRLKRIAHPTDLAPKSEFAFYHSLRLAVAAGSKLDVLHIDKEPVTVAWKDFPSISRTLARWNLALEGYDFGGNGERAQSITAYGREPVGPILDYLDESLPDLMVVATHRRHGLDRWLHKEVAQKLARSRALPTLFVPFGDEGFVSPSKGTVELRHVVMPVDWLPDPRVGVEAVTELGDVLGCGELELTLIHVSENLEDFPAISLPVRQGWRWDCRTRSGDVVDTVLKLAEDRNADLIVMVTKGHDGFLDALRGSTTERVLRGASCPLLAVPALDTAS